MEEDTEVLDWGHEDDEQHFNQQNQLTDDPDEDAVSLGGDEDDVEHYYAYHVPEGSSTVSEGPPVPVPQQQSQQQQQQQQVSAVNHEHQRDHSGNSQKTQSQSQSSPKQPSPKRSLSFGKMMHSLPPKPVSSSIPFLQPTHPSSIIEATAMSGSLPREKKSNGNTGKPLSPANGGDTLPPDWELKNARSGNGVYYYNVRTHQSTWTRPVSGARSPAKDKERGRTQTSESRPSLKSGNSSPNHLRASRTGRSEEPQMILPSTLSYDDRHYRPSDSTQTSGTAEKRREERSEPNNHRRSPTPPSRSPRILSPSLPLRPPSPVGRGRDDKRNSRSQRKASPNTTDELRDSQREKSRATVPRVSSPDRHWVAPEEFPPRKSSGRRPPPPDQHRRQRGDTVDVPSPPATPVNNEDRNSNSSSFRNDADWSSTLRHRSSPPHIRETKPTPTAQTSRASDSGVPSQGTTRSRTRFDQPASKSPKTSRAPPLNDDVYIPDDLLLGRREEPRPTFTQASGTEDDTKRRRTHDRANRPSSSSRRAAAQVESTLAPTTSSLNEGSVSPSSLSPAAGEQPRSKRTPLPPQSAHFRQVSKRSSSKTEQQQPALQVVPTASHDGGMMQSSTNAEHSLPSGPRHQPQQTRDANQVEPRKSSRLPPSGPSAGSATVRHRRSEPAFPAIQLLATRDRNAMEVDSAPPPRPPTLRVNDTTIRANSGMYADRESQRVEVVANTDAAPKGPRAMTNRMPSGSSHISLTSSPSTSPTTPLYNQRSAAPQEFPASRLRARSPPPHLVATNGFQPRDGPPARFSQLEGAMLRPGMPARGMSNINDRGSVPQGHYQMADQQPPRRELVNSQPRQDQFPHAPPPAPRGFSGSNTIPIGSRKGPSPSSLPQGVPSQPAHNSRSAPPAVVNVESTRNRSVRGDPQGQSNFEGPASPPVDRYNLSERNDTSRRRPPSGRMTPPHQHRPLSPIDSFQTSAALGRSRDDWYSGPNVSQSVVRVPQELSEPRIWTPRDAVQQNPSYEHMESDFRPATPPPPSRDPSWDAMERHRPASQYHNDRSQLNSQYDVITRHDAVEDMEPRHRRQPEVEIDRKRGRVSHLTSSHRNPGSYGSRPVHVSNDRHEEEAYRPRETSSPTAHRRPDSYPGHIAYANEGYRRNFPDDPRAADPIVERQVQSWDREPPSHTERPSSVYDRNIHRVYEQEHHSDINHNPYSARTRRSGPQMGEVVDYPVHYDISDDRQRPDTHGEQRKDIGDTLAPVSASHRRSESSRRGGSLLDRLSLDNSAAMSPQSLRDRVQVPSKRDREDIGNDSAGDIDMDDVGGPGDPALKKPRRRMKSRRGRRNGT